MKKAFNLRKYIKQAFYEDGRGYWNTQSRAWANCYKQKCNDGKKPQESWNECLSEYQRANDKGTWALSYAGPKDGGKRPYLDSKTPAAQKILNK